MMMTLWIATVASEILDVFLDVAPMGPVWTFAHPVRSHRTPGCEVVDGWTEPLPGTPEIRAFSLPMGGYESTLRRLGDAWELGGFYMHASDSYHTHYQRDAAEMFDAAIDRIGIYDHMDSREDALELPTVRFDENLHLDPCIHEVSDCCDCYPAHDCQCHNDESKADRDRRECWDD